MLDNMLCFRIGPRFQRTSGCAIPLSGAYCVAACEGGERWIAARGEELVTESYAEITGPGRPAGLRNSCFFILKLAVTATCLWYAFRQVNLRDLAHILAKFDSAWALLTVLLLVVETPLAGLRWREIFDALETQGKRSHPGPMFAVTAIGIFVAQVLPNVAGDAARVWLLTRLGRSWRLGVMSVIIDRCVGVLVLLTLGFCILLLPSAFTALGGHHMAVLRLFGAILFPAWLCFAFLPQIGSTLERFELVRPLAQLVQATRRALTRYPGGLQIFGLALAIHVLTILSVWSLSRAQALPFTLDDAAVLFTVMTAISVLPISIAGWGLRELAVVALLQAHGVAVELALLFWLSFGLVMLAASLPGAIVWAVYTPAPTVDRLLMVE